MAAAQEVFEVESIVDDKLSDGVILYRVKWADTVTTELQPFLDKYENEIKNVTAQGSKLRILWKDSWLSADKLIVTCDEYFGAYLLMKLYNASS